MHFIAHPFLFNCCTGASEAECCCEQDERVTQGHGMSARCPGPETAAADSTAAEMSAVPYCQPSCEKHMVKMEIFFHSSCWNILRHRTVCKCVQPTT